jgi:hypothetical protein
VPKGLFDDLFVSLGVLLSGYRVVRAPDLRAFEMHTTLAFEEFRRKVRIACECMHVHIELWPELRHLNAWNLYKYIGHRLLRWIGGYFLLAGVLLFYASAALAFGPLAAVLGVGVLLALFAAGLWARIRVARTLLNVLLAFVGNAVGAWRALRGKRAIIWDPLSSTREALPDVRTASR